MPRGTIAHWVSQLLDERVVNINSPERMTIPANWLTAFGKSDEDKRFDEWRSRSDFDYRNTAEWTWENGLGQCSEHANTAYYILREAGVQGNVRIFTAPGHEFTAWGMPAGADPNDPSTWGDNAWVVDGWLGNAFTPGEVQDSPYFKNGAGGDPRPIVESTTSFDPEAGAWEVTASGSSSDGAEEIDCFVATAAYGTPMAREIGVLRDFRDEFLRHRAAGRLFIAGYETVGPHLANAIRGHDTARAAVRAGLLRPVDVLLRVTRTWWGGGGTWRDGGGTWRDDTAGEDGR